MELNPSSLPVAPRLPPVPVPPALTQPATTATATTQQQSPVVSQQSPVVSQQSYSNDSLGDLFSAAGTPPTSLAQLSQLSQLPAVNNVYSNAVVDFQKASADVYETLRGQISRILVIYTGGTIGMKSLNPEKSLEGMHRFNDRSAIPSSPLSEPLTDLIRFQQRTKGSVSPPNSNGDLRQSPVVATPTPPPSSSSSTTTTTTAATTATTTDTTLTMNDLSMADGPTASAAPLSTGKAAVGTIRQPALITPLSLYGKRIRYSILEYTPLLDSANMNMHDWIKIAADIEVNYAHFDAFVILHGTDTMAYTASALSFMLEDLGKTVIITGSQVPLSEWRTDAEENLLGSLMIAGHFVIPEVCVYFGHKLFRGNRCTKIDAMDFSAFDSPNLKPLATMGVNIDINWSAVRRAHNIARFRVHTELNPNVATLRLFPGITTSTVKAFLAPPMEGVVLETYGAGNAPNSRKDLMQLFKDACDRGVVIVNCSQCKRGLVSDMYATGKALFDLGIVPGSDMTPECALAKLTYLLGKRKGPEEVRRLVTKNLRGELTILHSPLQNTAPHVHFHNVAFVNALAQTLRIQSANERRSLELALIPHLVCAAAGSGNREAFEKLREASTSTAMIVNALDFDGRSGLHIAAATGNYSVVEQLLLMGASVHIRDRHEWTPLAWACRNRHADVAALLVRAGANIDPKDEDAYVDFFRAVQAGNLSVVQMYVDCGIEVNATGFGKQTALHVACAEKQLAVAAYLESLPAVRTDLKDLYGKVPKEYL